MTATVHTYQPLDPQLSRIGSSMAQAGAELVGLAVMVGDALAGAIIDVNSRWDTNEVMVVTALVPTHDAMLLATDRLADYELLPSWRGDFRSDHRAAIYTIGTLQLELMVKR